jgi:hypothetical protein
VNAIALGIGQPPILADQLLRPERASSSEASRLGDSGRMAIRQLPSVNSIESAGAHCTKRQIALGDSNVGSANDLARRINDLGWAKLNCRSGPKKLAKRANFNFSMRGQK